MGNILHEVASASLTNPSAIQKIKDEAKQFGDNLPESVKTCLNGNAEIAALGLKYGIDDKTDTDALEKKIIAYLALHFLSVHKTLQDVDNSWHKASYKQTGNQLAALGHQLIKLTSEDIRRLVA